MVTAVVPAVITVVILVAVLVVVVVIIIAVMCILKKHKGAALKGLYIMMYTAYLVYTNMYSGNLQAVEITKKVNLRHREHIYYYTLE